MSVFYDGFIVPEKYTKNKYPNKVICEKAQLELLPHNLTGKYAIY